MRLCSRFCQLQNCLAVGDLRSSNVRFHAEFSHHAVDDNFKVKLTHSGDQRLPGVYVGMNAVRGSSCASFERAVAYFFLVGVCLGFDCY